MKKVIFFALLLVPGTSFARTDCKLVEFADHVEAVCTGDEKAVVQPEQKDQKAPPPPAAESLPYTPIQTAETPAKNDGTTREVSPQPPPAPTPVLTHRQGRSNQASQSGLQDAISARRTMLMEHSRQNEAAPVPAPPPAQ